MKDLYMNTHVHLHKNIGIKVLSYAPLRKQLYSYYCLTFLPLFPNTTKTRKDKQFLFVINFFNASFFSQLINHGVSNSLIEKMKVEIPNFFNLPMEEKKKYWQQPGDIQGFGQAFVVSEEQKLDWADMFAMYTLPTYLRKPHLFPKLPLHFRLSSLSHIH